MESVSDGEGRDTHDPRGSAGCLPPPGLARASARRDLSAPLPGATQEGGGPCLLLWPSVKCLARAPPRLSTRPDPVFILPRPIGPASWFTFCKTIKQRVNSRGKRSTRGPPRGGTCPEHLRKQNLRRVSTEPTASQALKRP